MNRIRSLTMGYSLGIYIKIGGSQIRNIMHQARRVSQTDDTHTIIPCIGCPCE